MRTIQLVTVMALSFGLAIPVQAQEATEPAVPAAPEVPTDLPDIKPEDVTQGQIVSFVNAMIGAERVRRTYIERIDAAETEEEIQELIAEADRRGMRAVENVPGITVGEYIAISKLAQEDEELNARVGERFRSMMEDQGLALPQTNDGENADAE